MAIATEATLYARSFTPFSFRSHLMLGVATLKAGVIIAVCLGGVGLISTGLVICAAQVFGTDRLVLVSPVQAGVGAVLLF